VFETDSSILSQPVGHLGSIRPDQSGMDLLEVALSELNRSDQMRKVAAWINRRPRSRTIIVIPARPDDFYHYFVFRIARSPEILLGDARHDLGLLEWPNPEFESIFKELSTRVVGALRRSGEQQLKPVKRAFERSVREISGSIIFSHFASVRRLKQDDGRVLDDWFKYFSEDCPTPKRGHLIAVICFQVPYEPNQIDDSWLESRLTTLISRHAQVVLKLEDLPAIPSDLVSEWAGGLMQRAPFRPWSEYLRDVHFKAYEANQVEARFAHIRTRILEYAKTWPRAQPTFITCIT
jgi:hypothetical protein